MKLSIYTLGCKVNQNESGALMELFIKHGFTPALPDETADVYMVNSCTVTSGGDKKSLQWLRRAKRLNPNAVTVLTGCYPQAFPDEAALALEADVITGSNARNEILPAVLDFIANRQRTIAITPHERSEIFEELPMESLAGHTRAFMKIEDGCNRRCAYCVIPRARGNVRSRSEDNIIAELHALAASGYHEVVFSGINLSSYGKDTRTNLADIVERAANVNGIERIRLGSLEPDLMDDNTIARLAAVPQFCPQFHLALQSGCDETLRRMRRVYTTAQFAEIVQKIRTALPHATFTTDVIVGFPGENIEEFNATTEFVKQMQFLKVHVFSYSRRAGTPAAEMPAQVHEREKTRRNHALQEIADAVRAKVIAERFGSIESVLLETAVSENTFTGYTMGYIPVTVTANGHKSGDIVSVILGAFDGERCAATMA